MYSYVMEIALLCKFVVQASRPIGAHPFSRRCQELRDWDFYNLVQRSLRPIQRLSWICSQPSKLLSGLTCIYSCLHLQSQMICNSIRTVGSGSISQFGSLGCRATLFVFTWMVHSAQWNSMLGLLLPPLFVLSRTGTKREWFLVAFKLVTLTTLKLWPRLWLLSLRMTFPSRFSLGKHRCRWFSIGGWKLQVRILSYFFAAARALVASHLQRMSGTAMGDLATYQWDLEERWLCRPTGSMEIRQVPSLCGSRYWCFNLKDDNKAAIVRFEGPSPTCKPCRQSRRRALQDVAVATFDPGAFTAITTPDFTVDVHTHAHLLEQQLLQQLAKHSVKRPKVPRKESMSPDTWQLVLTKRDWRKHLWEAQALQKRTLLLTCFQAWHDPKDEGHSHWLPLRALIRHQDAMIAQAMSPVQWLGRQVVKTLRHDDAAFFHELAKEAGSFIQPQQAKDLWRVIRRSLPKFQQRRMQAPPEQLEALENQWHPYFQQLE